MISVDESTLSSMVYADRFNEGLRRPGRDRKGAAKAMGITVQAVGAIANGGTKSATAENNAKAAAYFGCDPTWLASGKGHPNWADSTPVSISLADNPEYPAIRRVQFKLSAGASGYGVEYLDEDSEPIVFRREWFNSRGLQPDKLFAVEVRNGSMQPSLWAGDTVVVNTLDTEPRDGEVFAVNFEGELIVKRLVRDAGQWWLTSDNPDQRRYPRKACDDGVVLIGRIVHKQSEHI
ncbi:MAG: helix-turn-helix domain-containing protein [Burkholderiaceae bacterium]|nr:helix-turn-helix domain-containing protein [Burkholderiaceae bacterium]